MVWVCSASHSGRRDLGCGGEGGVQRSCDHSQQLVDDSVEAEEVTTSIILLLGRGGRGGEGEGSKCQNHTQSMCECLIPMSSSACILREQETGHQAQSCAQLHWAGGNRSHDSHVIKHVTANVTFTEAHASIVAKADVADGRFCQSIQHS